MGNNCGGYLEVGTASAHIHAVAKGLRFTGYRIEKRRPTMMKAGATVQRVGGP